ncbi:MAG: PDZ domain-containing protein [Desulfovibrio sp.]|jgi:serine protease Do|nr:PDZ domain-containing protein [Desulfovibrio sp.]
MRVPLSFFGWITILCLSFILMGTPAWTAEQTSRGWMGITVQDVDEAAAKALALPKAGGALVNDAFADQPAMKAGIRPADVIVALNGNNVANARDLLEKMAAIKPGSAANVTIWREGKQQELSVAVGERPEPQMAECGGCRCAPTQADSGRIGVMVQEVSAEETARMGLDSAGLLIVRVFPDTVASTAGLHSGDVIVSAGNTPLSTAKEAKAAIAAAQGNNSAIFLRIYRHGGFSFRALDFS